MDSLKFAFDTLIIGALALPWLWLFMRIFFQRSNGQDVKFPIISALSDSTRQMVGGVLILALGYFPGSAVSRISSDFSMMPKSCTDCPRRPRFVRAFIFTSIATSTAFLLPRNCRLNWLERAEEPLFATTQIWRNW